MFEGNANRKVNPYPFKTSWRRSCVRACICMSTSSICEVKYFFKHMDGRVQLPNPLLDGVQFCHIMPGVGISTIYLNNLPNHLSSWTN